MSRLSKAMFWAALLPDLLKLSQLLYKLFDGDAKRARLEVSRIRDHGERLRRAEADLEARLDRIPDDKATP